MNDISIRGAGELTARDIGRSISATTNTGASITDVLVEVRYMAPGEYRQPLGDGSPADDSPLVWVRFKNSGPAHDFRMQGMEGSTGFWLDVASVVEVAV